MQRYYFFLISANFLKLIFTNRVIFVFFAKYIRDFGYQLAQYITRKEYCANFARGAAIPGATVTGRALVPSAFQIRPG